MPSEAVKPTFSLFSPYFSFSPLLSLVSTPMSQPTYKATTPEEKPYIFPFPLQVVDNDTCARKGTGKGQG